MTLPLPLLSLIPIDLLFSHNHDRTTHLIVNLHHRLSLLRLLQPLPLILVQLEELQILILNIYLHLDLAVQLHRTNQQTVTNCLIEKGIEVDGGEIQELVEKVLVMEEEEEEQSRRNGMDLRQLVRNVNYP
jgi:hypothetical protein